MLKKKGVTISDSNSFTVNLGMAEDALFEKRFEGLLVKSGFTFFRDQLKNFLLNSGIKELERTRLADIHSSLSKIKKGLDKAKQDADHKIKDIESCLENVKKIKDNLRINIGNIRVKRSAEGIIINRKGDDDTEKSVWQNWSKYADYVEQIVAETKDVPDNIRSEINLMPIAGDGETNANDKMEKACYFLKAKLEELIAVSDYRRKIRDSVFHGDGEKKAVIETEEEKIKEQVNEFFKNINDKYGIRLVESEWDSLLYKSDEWIPILKVADLNVSRFNIPWWEPRYFGHNEKDLKRHFRNRLSEWKRASEDHLKSYINGIEKACEELTKERRKSWIEAIKHIEEKVQEEIGPKKQRCYDLINTVNNIGKEARGLIEISADYEN